MGKKKIKRTKHNENRYRQMGLLISYYRRMKGYTQDDLSEMLDISAGYLSQVESQSRMQPISMDLFFNIADNLGIEPYQLLEFRQGKDQGK